MTNSDNKTCNASITSTKLRLEADLENIRKQLLNNILELYFLKNDGHMHEYQAWLDKAPASSIIFQTEDENLQNDDKFNQLKNLNLPLKSATTSSSGPVTRQNEQQQNLQQETTSAVSTNAGIEVPVAKVSSTATYPTSGNEFDVPESKTASEHKSRIASSTALEPTSPPQSADAVAADDSYTAETTPTPVADGSPVTSDKNSTSPTPIEVDEPTSLKTHKPAACAEAKSTSISDSTRATKTTVPAQAKDSSFLDDLSLSAIIAPPPAKRPHRDDRASSLGPTKGSQSNTEYMAQALKRAKHEAAVTTRVNELRKQGLWSQKKLPKLQEPARPKTHWDYVLEEMTWLSTDFAAERQWKKLAAKKCAHWCYKYHRTEQSKIERAEREHHQLIKRLAAAQAKEIRAFWSTVEKVVDFRQQAKLEQTRKQALDLHLNYILDHTGKLSHDIQKSMVRDTSHRTSVDDQNESEQDATDDDVEMEVEVETIADSIPENDAASIPSDNGTRANESRNSVDVGIDGSEKQHKDSDYDSSVDDYTNNTNKDTTTEVETVIDVSIPCMLVLCASKFE